MESNLTLCPSLRIGSARVLIDPDHVYQYDVVGLPSGQSATIAKMTCSRWMIWRSEDGARGWWVGDYDTAEEALEEIQREFADPETVTH